MRVCGAGGARLDVRRCPGGGFARGCCSRAVVVLVGLAQRLKTRRLSTACSSCTRLLLLLLALLLLLPLLLPLLLLLAAFYSDVAGGVQGGGIPPVRSGAIRCGVDGPAHAGHEWPRCARALWDCKIRALSLARQYSSPARSTLTHARTHTNGRPNLNDQSLTLFSPSRCSLSSRSASALAPALAVSHSCSLPLSSALPSVSVCLGLGGRGHPGHPAKPRQAGATHDRLDRGHAARR